MGFGEHWDFAGVAPLEGPLGLAFLAGVRVTPALNRILAVRTDWSQGTSFADVLADSSGKPGVCVASGVRDESRRLAPREGVGAGLTGALQ